MSRQRVVLGLDERGRPKTAWADPDPVDEPRYGHMQPAYDAGSIERRVAVPDELAARNDERPLPFQTGAVGPRRPDAIPLDRMQRSRLRGAARHVEVMAARRAPAAPEEDLIVTDVDVPAEAPLLRVAAAATTAHEARVAWEAALVARNAAMTAFDQALAALREAWRDAGMDPATVSVPAAAIAADLVERTLGGSTRSSTNIPEIMHSAEPAPPAEAPEGAAPRPVKAPKRGSDATRRRAAAERATRVLEVLERHGGDTKAAGKELGMRGNVVGRIAAAARARKSA